MTAIRDLGPLALFVLSLPVGCKPARQDTSQAAPSASTVPTILPLVEQKRSAFSFALFAGTKLLMCYDYEVSPDAAAKIVAENTAKTDAGEPNLTRLNQTCDSLGQTALATCTHSGAGGTIVERYYDAKRTDKFMAGCVKGGSKWESNKSPEADVSRAQQELDALKPGQ